MSDVGNIANEAAEQSPCPYVKRDEGGTAYCELAETGIKVFEQKASTAERVAKDWQHEFNMYRLAWIRELGGKVIPKTHEIDALVLTTRALREERDRLRKEVESWKKRAEQHGCDVVNGDPDCG